MDSHKKLLIISIVLLLMFIYFGSNFQTEITETMQWSSFKFKLSLMTKITGFLLLISVFLLFKPKK
jgi:hypothetical protein